MNIDNKVSARTSVSTKTVLALLAGLLAALLMALPAYAQLSRASTQNTTSPNGGINANTGFPRWYQDASGIRLELCLESPLCLGGRQIPAGETPNLGNMPDEAFYAVARTETTLAGGGGIRWRAVLEGAFANEVPAAGDQIVFTRTQVTGSNINTRRYPAGTTLRFVTPYGNLKGRVGSAGTLNRIRLESGLGRAGNDFLPPATETRTGYGPRFMKWDAGRPADFLGNPLRLHTATGGPNPAATSANGNNTFQVFRVFRNGSARAVSPVERRFEISGQCVQNTC